MGHPVKIKLSNNGLANSPLHHTRCRYLSYAPPAYECGTRPFLRWVLSQGRSPTRQAVPKIPRTPSVFHFSGRLRRRAINPTLPKRVKAWGDGRLRPEVMYPVVEHTRMNCAARNHSRSRAPHHRTQSNLSLYLVITFKSIYLKKTKYVDVLAQDCSILLNVIPSC